ncbi:hypothetical protein [Rhizobium sp. AC27/96]|uniref:hypothetical protein n=1 Tax=Rhizobium sp. AC27/96 TaxID=1841653 RepID=UPI000B3194E3|nr:hypothetical protein [Rhizobium sp. AC27/96]
MRTRPAEQAKSIWGSFASDLKQSLAENEEPAVSAPVREHCTEVSDPVQAIAANHDEVSISPPRSGFVEKWAAKRAEKPKAGAADMVATFLRRLERQKTLLAEFEADPSGFNSWRSAWFRKVNGGFGISIGYDRIDAGGGLRYIVVETLRDVSEFLDDLGHHAQTDKNFQRALSESRSRRAGRRVGATAA